MNQYIKDLINDSYADGTLCYSCGNLNENLITNDRILNTPVGKPYICNKCLDDMKNEPSVIMTTAYTFDVDTNNNVKFTSLLERGFEFGERKNL